MILDAANEQRFHVIFTGNAAEVGPHALLDILADPRLAVLGAENDVVVQGCEGVGHARTIAQSVEKDDWKMVSLAKRAS